MSEETQKEIARLRKDLGLNGDAGVEQRTALAMKQAIRNPYVRVALIVGTLGGSGWAFDAPTTIANAFHRDPKPEQRVSVEDLSRALVFTPEYVLLKAKLEGVSAKQDTMDGKLDLLVAAEARRKGREDAMREALRERRAR